MIAELRQIGLISFFCRLLVERRLEGGMALRKSFKVVKCPRCGFFQLTTASKSVRCFSCGHAWQLDNDSILFSSFDSEEARRFLIKLKRGGSLEFKKASQGGLE